MHALSRFIYLLVHIGYQNHLLAHKSPPTTLRLRLFALITVHIWNILSSTYLNHLYLRTRSCNSNMEKANPAQAGTRSSGTSSPTINEPLRQEPFRRETLSFDLPLACPLRIFTNRCTPCEPCEDGFTLIFIHAIGMHKETWETMLARLFDSTKPGGHGIREAYSFDIPNHGESAIFNSETIGKLYGEDWSFKDTASAFNRLLTIHPSRGLGVDFSKRKLIGIGHSIGAVVLCLMHSVRTPPPVFQSIIMIEPGIAVPQVPDSQTGLQSLSAWNWLRNDTWSSRKSARAALSRDLSYSGTWDKRVLDLYVKHALTTHSAAKYDGVFKFAGVTTAISRIQEAACYRTDDLVKDSMKAYTSLFFQSTPIKVHIVCGTEKSVITPSMQRALCQVAPGRGSVNVRHIAGVGHLAVQQRPDDVAHAISCVLSEDAQKFRQADGIKQMARARL